MTWPVVLLLAGLAAARREAPGERGAAPRAAGTIRVARWVAVAVAVVAFVSATFPYLALRYIDLAYKDLATSEQTALADAGRGRRSEPPLRRPLVTRAKKSTKRPLPPT